MERNASTIHSLWCVCAIHTSLIFDPLALLCGGRPVRRLSQLTETCRPFRSPTFPRRWPVNFFSWCSLGRGTESERTESDGPIGGGELSCSQGLGRSDNQLNDEKRSRLRWHFCGRCECCMRYSPKSEVERHMGGLRQTRRSRLTSHTRHQHVWEGWIGCACLWFLRASWHRREI